MRVSQYKIVNELCASILEAYRIIERTKNYALLSDCIDALTIIAESIEEENTPKMDDTIGGMVELLPDNAANGNNMPRLILLAEKLQKIAKKELKYRIRVLFVAELSSKWDSLESVYEAFMKRDDIDVDVVLEPIFRATKMLDGTVKSEIIYEDWLTPMGIENIPYTAYNMEQIQPDITFISQPYESVTVPMFWPENIAKYSRLVYAPYFMATSMHWGVSFESFMTLSTQSFSWIILCQSEEMKNHYRLTASKHGENVLVTGLPKWDHVKKINKTNCPCPKEWNGKLRGKTVLYNTHFSKNYNQVDVNSKDNIFGYINGSDNLSMIWRPHPMTETVLKLYKPSEYEFYQKLVNQINDSPNIVIDTSSNYDKSFAWSDVLLEGNNSLLPQYILQNKEVVVMPDDEEKVEIILNSFADGLMDYRNFFVSSELQKVLEYIEEIDVEKRKDNIKSVIDSYMSLSYGNVGENVSKEVINKFRDEEQI